MVKLSVEKKIFVMHSLWLFFMMQECLSVSVLWESLLNQQNNSLIDQPVDSEER